MWSVIFSRESSSFSSASIRVENRRETASALVITLSVLVLVTILVVGIMAIARTERVSANSHFETRRAKSLAMMGVDNATALIRQAVDAGSQPGNFWASQPGKVTVFQADGTVDATLGRFLFSTNAGGTNVNLNQAGFGGIAPIASSNSVGTNATPAMAVSWETVLQDPSSPASATNRIVGRYAFWVDDESAKLNVNTADGTQKGTTNSFGPGAPTEASLTSLKTGGTTNISATTAASISTQSGARYSNSVTPRAFNDASEILQVSGSATNVVADNNFNTTAYSRAPELNIFGEPKIYLMTATTNAVPLNANTGVYAYSGSGATPSAVTGASLSQVYPMSSATAGFNQLPNFTYRPNGAAADVTARLPQFFQDQSRAGNGQKFSTTSLDAAKQDYDLGMRIARYLKGFNSQGAGITWPTFPGSGTTGFAGKYTDRQIDSIALQILSFAKASYVDHFRKFSIPYVMPKGFLSGKLVNGLSRGPRANEIVIDVTTVAGNPPKVSMAIYIEWFLPKEFSGIDIDGDVASWFYGNGNYMTFLNLQDAVQLSISGVITGASPLGGFWTDNMLTFLDQNGQPAGVDLFGNDPSADDPDQVRAHLYHNPSSLPNDTQLPGSGPIPGRHSPMLFMLSPMGWYSAASPTQIWKPGEYRVSKNQNETGLFPMKAGVTSLKLGGGLAFGLHTASGGEFGGWNVNPVPLDSLRGQFMGESLSDASVRAAVLEAVIPMPNVTIPIPGSVRIHLQVADPLVNSFPGDWVATVNPPASEITMRIPPGRDPIVYTDGRNSIAAPSASGGGDPLASWWPEQSVSIPKSQRFPSSGFLQYVRTGLMPDKTADALPLSQQHGTPNRILNFAPSTAASQQTDGGTSYPDWAMLDLFTVPAALQPLGSPAPAPVQLTWGGATAGRVNVNSAILPFSGVARTVPLEGIFKGIQTSTSYDASGNPIQATVDEVALAAAINQYLVALGRPLMLPGEVCNIPEVAAYLYTGVGNAARSRNDLVRQIVGNLTTRSNTFSIYALGQVIKKAAGNTDYGTVQPGDNVMGESKLKVVVERVLNYGADGVPGNTQNPGTDGVVGTPDDPVDAVYHPAMTYPLPYKYRVVSVREIVN